MVGLRVIQKYEFKSAAAEPEGVQAFTVDRPKGLVRAWASGHWSMRLMRSFFSAYGAEIAAIRDTGLPLRVIADVRESAVQSEEVAQFILERVSTLYRPGDRVALIVATSMLKAQLRAVLPPGIHEYFLSGDAAEKWVMAHLQTGTPGHRYAAPIPPPVQDPARPM
jgi:hypothetical protein